VNYALRKRFVKVVDIEQFEVGEPGITKYVNKRYHQQIQKTRRIYPHTLNMDGFYVARMVKVSNGEKRDEEGEGEGKEGENVESLGVEEEGKQQQSERKRDRKKNKGEAPKVETPAQEVRKVKQDTVEQIKS
jgi:ribosomal RNA methyltransferase Nop2